MEPAKRTGLEQELHTLVARLFAAPPAGRAQVFAELVQQACLVMQLEQEAGLRPAATPEAEALPPGPDPAEPPAELIAAEPEALPVLEGPFARLAQGGLLLHAEGDLHISEAEVAAHRFQHGDIIRALPSGKDGYRYEGVCPGPLTNPAACTAIGPVVDADDDFALLRLSNGDRVVVPTREIEAHCDERLAVLTVTYLKDDRWGARFAGRVLKVHPTEPRPPAPAPRGQRRKRQDEADGDAESRPARLPQFARIEGRRPVIAVVGGEVKQRIRYHAILEEFGATYRRLPYSPSDRQIERAAKACDLVIGMPGCCRHLHLDSVKKHAKNLGGVWVLAPSHNESGFRKYVADELIPHWRRLLDEMDRA